MSKGNGTRLSRIVRNFLIIYSDKERKALHRIIGEFLIASLKSKCIATYYFTSFLYKRTITNYMDHISHKEGRYLQRALCDNETFAIQGNKLFFHLYFENAKMPLPRLLAYSIREKFLVKSGNGWITHEITTSDALHNIIKVLLTESSNNSIFLKPAIGSGGMGAIKISDWNREYPNSKTNEFLNHFLSRAYIFEDEVKQHEELSTLNPSSLNTIRIDTFKAFGEKPEILSAYLRIGRASGCVDNLAAGGYRVGINMEDGNLKSYGTNKIEDGVKFATCHVDTGIKFEGFPIPFFEEVKHLAVEAANYLPQSLIGWDIAMSENGPVLIECNSVYYHMVGADIAYGGYRKNPVFRKVVDYANNGLIKRTI
jgi:hypothetical protein